MVCRAFSVFLCVVPLLHICLGNSAARMTFSWRWGGAVGPAVYVCGCYRNCIEKKHNYNESALPKTVVCDKTHGVRDIFAQPHLNIVTATLKPKGHQQTASLTLKTPFSTFESGYDLFFCYFELFYVLTCFYGCSGASYRFEDSCQLQSLCFWHLHFSLQVQYK